MSRSRIYRLFCMTGDEGVRLSSQGEISLSTNDCIDWKIYICNNHSKICCQNLGVCHLSNKVKSSICLIALLSFPKPFSHLFQFLHLSHIQPFFLADRVYRRPAALLPLAFNNIRESLGLIFGNILQHLRLY